MRLRLRLLHRFGQRRHNLERVPNNAVVGHLENWRVPVLVDGNDCARRAHAGEMLNGARDTDRNVQSRTHVPSRLTDLIRVRTPTFVSYGARGPNSGVAKG